MERIRKLLHAPMTQPFLVGVLGVLLPALVLLYFGIRSFGYEDQLLAREEAERQGRAIALANSQFEQRVEEWTAMLQSVAVQIFQGKRPPGEIYSDLAALNHLRDLPIHGAYFFAENVIQPPVASRSFTRQDIKEYLKAGNAFQENHWPAVNALVGVWPGNSKSGLGCRENECALVTRWISPSGTAGWLVAELKLEGLSQAVRNFLNQLSRTASLNDAWYWNPNGIQRPAKDPRYYPPPSFNLLHAPDQQENPQHQRRLIFSGIIALSIVIILQGLWTLSKAIRREIRVSEMKADFLATVSHELRTPLTAIRYIGERLRDGRFTSDEERQDFYRLLIEESDHLKTLIDDLLDFTAMAKGRRAYHLQKLDLRQAADDALQRLQPSLEAKAFVVQKDYDADPVEVLFDHRALVQAISNLLDNATKYSGESRDIRVEVHKVKDGGRVSIQDFGIGIAPEEQRFIFDRFYRVEHALTRSSQGVGLGLPMVKLVAEAHQGRVELSSEKGKGSRFAIWLPERAV